MLSRRRLSATVRSLAPRFRRHYMLTRLGFHVVFVACFAMVGGALRGFNLLLVLAGILVGALLMQWRFSRAMLGGVTVIRRLPAEAMAGVSFRVRYRVRNSGRILPAWMLRIEDRIGLGYRRRSYSARRNDLPATCAFGYVAPGATKFTHIDCTINRRGQYQFGPIAVSTLFPFSLLTARKLSRESEPLCVLPRLLQLRGGWEKNLLSRSDGVASGSQRSGMAEGEFFGLREWQSGDNPRWIHWRTTARIDELAVRQFEQHRRFDTCILLDGFDPTPDTRGAEKTSETESDVEFAISLAATLIVRIGSQPSNRVALATAATRSVVIDGSHTADSKKSMLQQLAEVKTCDNPKLNDALRELGDRVGNQLDLIVVSPRSLDDVMASERENDGASSSSSIRNCLAPWTTRDSFRWLDIRQADVLHWASRAVTDQTSFSEPQLERQSQPRMREVAP